MNISSQPNFTLALVIAAVAVSMEPVMAQNSIFEEHRQRRENIIDGIGEAILNIFGPSHHEHYHEEDYSNPDHIYETRPRREVPPGWDAPFPPPSDMITPRERYEIYRREQQRRYQPREEVVRRELREWRPEPAPQPQPQTQQRGTGLTIEGPYFEETPTNRVPSERIEPESVEIEPEYKSTTVIPEGRREDRRGSAVLPEPKPLTQPEPLNEDRIPPPPIPEGEEENVEIGSMPPLAKPAVGSDEAPKEEMVIGGQSSEPMSNFEKISLDTEFTTSSGGVISLGDLLQGQNAVMLDFWATWSGESMSSLASINTLEAEMQALGIAVVGVNIDGTADTAERVRRGQEIEVPWLLEPRDRPFSQGMGINDVPHRVLIDAWGNVRFSGRPTDDSLRTALDEIVNQSLESNQ